MHLNNDSYSALKKGVKNIEVRLFDEKRRALQLGDIIEFANLQDENFEPLQARVIGLLRYGTFAELAADFRLERISAKIRDKAEWIESNYSIYTREQERKLGVLGIRIELIK